MKKTMKYLSLLLFTLFTGYTVTKAQSKIEKRFDGISTLEIAGGSMEISYEGTSGKSHVEVLADMGDEKDAGKDLVFITIGNTLKISCQSPANSWGCSTNRKRYVHISGPESIKLRANSSSGKMRIKNVKSDLTELSAGSGIIEIENISGELQLKGSSGKIVANNIQGMVTCQMTSGIADLEYIKGNTYLSSSSGQIKARHIAGELNVKITSGSVSLEDVSTLGELKLSSGLISAKHVGFGPNTSFSGSSGAFKIKATALLDQYNYDLSAGSGIVKVGKMSSGDHLVIDHGSAHTIRGKIGSGIISIVAL